MSLHLVRGAGAYARFAAGLPRFTRTRLTLENARETVRRRLDHRPESFLWLVGRAVYENPASPYLPLLRDAGCEPGDLRAMVVDRGVEETLAALRGEGVYVTFDEFKGRMPIERNGRVIEVTERSFDNPFLARHFESRTGGSTGVPSRIPHDLDSLLAQAHTKILGYHAHGALDAPLGMWRDGLPSVIGVKNVLQAIVMGNPVRRWFTPTPPGHAALRFRLADAFVVGACRLLGHPVPRPEPVPPSRAAAVVEWADSALSDAGTCLLRTSPSLALRVGTAAEERGVDLTGLVIMGGGEPVTPGKVDPVVRTGARFVPTYAFTEVGWAGIGCGDPSDPSDVHLLEDALALITVPQRIPGIDLEVDGFCFTTLLPSSPRILLNAEIDDFGVMERRPCGCALGAIGYGTHLRDIRSHRKLTGEGATLIGTDMIRILEEVLPARFGGGPHHYQLHEREDPDGLTRLVLVVDPEITLPEDREAIDAVLDALSRGGAMARYARALWRQAESLRVERERPVWSGNGKFPPLVVDR